jgi:hypothetical protein
MRSILPYHRAPGTGMIHAERYGGYAAYTPSGRPGGRIKLGKFGSRHQAGKAIDKWLAENPEVEKHQ